MSFSTAIRGRLTNMRSSLIWAVLAALAATGCQQKMAEQPAPRSYEQSAMFANKQSARPLERGVVHRNQIAEDDPLTTWLTPAAFKGRTGEFRADGTGSFDPNSIVKLVGAPDSVDNFVKEFPFVLNEDDLKRGQTLFNANCALCHGAAGYGNGKIVERGFLKPPSYHTDPNGTAEDSSHLVGDGRKSLLVGYSRGFDRWGVKVALKDVPVGYIYQVIAWGYGGMASHAVQIPKPEDRWRVIGYIRALQYSQNAPVNELPTEIKTALNSVGRSEVKH